MADTKVSGLTAATTLDGTETFPVVQGGTSKQASMELLFDRINGNSGVAGPYKTFQKLSADSASQTSVTPATVMTTTGVGVGTWHFEYTLIFQTAATTTGIRISNNHTGTVTTYQMHSDFLSTGGAAATGVTDAIAASATAGLHEGHGERVLNANSKATVGVATANANQMIVVRGIMVVTVTGDLQFRLGTEIAGSAVKLMADSVLELTKIG